MIAPVGEKLLFEHTKFSATRGGGDHPYHHHPPVSATVLDTFWHYHLILKNIITQIHISVGTYNINESFQYFEDFLHERARDGFCPKE